MMGLPMQVDAVDTDDRGRGRRGPVGYVAFSIGGAGGGKVWTRGARGKLSMVIVKLDTNHCSQGANTEQTRGSGILTKSSGDPKEGRKGDGNKQTSTQGATQRIRWWT